MKKKFSRNCCFNNKYYTGIVFFLVSCFCSPVVKTMNQDEVEMEAAVTTFSHQEKKRLQKEHKKVYINFLKDGCKQIDTFSIVPLTSLMINHHLVVEYTYDSRCTTKSGKFLPQYIPSAKCPTCNKNVSQEEEMDCFSKIKAGHQKWVNQYMQNFLYPTDNGYVFSKGPIQFYEHNVAIPVYHSESDSIILKPISFDECPLCCKTCTQ